MQLAVNNMRRDALTVSTSGNPAAASFVAVWTKIHPRGTTGGLFEEEIP